MFNSTCYWLLATTAMTACLWIPYVLDRMWRLGVIRTISNLSAADLEEQSPWARRAQKAHANAVENLAVFAPLALLAIHYEHGEAPLAVGAAATYFFARLVHFVVHALGVPGLRTVSFVVGWGAQLAMVLVLTGGRPC